MPAVLAACGPAGSKRDEAHAIAPIHAAPAIATASPSTAPVSFYATPFEHHPDAAALTGLGRALFFETALSASGRMACASCHDPAHAWGPPNGLAVQRGADGKAFGVRAVPSLKYQQDTPPFDEHQRDADGDDSIDQGPAGGRGWDGRAASAHEQAALPLLSPFEMANADRDAVVRRLAASASAARFRETFGPHVLDHPDHAWNGILWALEVFQQSPADFYPYDSKYDAFLRGQATLDATERRGLALFNDPAKGNCASCHPSGVKRGAFPAFTDHGLVALGVPRNPRIPANADPTYRDLGLCGPWRTDLADHPDYCGRFKTPTLRNVATRRVFFHNGAFTRLEDVLDFYAERDLAPGRFFAHDRRGSAIRYDDLRAADRANVNADPPFDRKPGDRPALDRRERADIIAFLRTLTDGYGAINAASTPARAGGGSERRADRPSR
jgi:cytochrome c peroxidase